MNNTPNNLGSAILDLIQIDRRGQLAELVADFNSRCRESVGLHDLQPVPAGDGSRVDCIAKVACLLLDVPFETCRQATADILSPNPRRRIGLQTIVDWSNTSDAGKNILAEFEQYGLDAMLAPYAGRADHAVVGNITPTRRRRRPV